VLTYASGGNLSLVLIAAAILLIILGLGCRRRGLHHGRALVAPVLVATFKMPVMVAHMFMLVLSCMSRSHAFGGAAMASAALAGANRTGSAGMASSWLRGFVLPS